MLFSTWDQVSSTQATDEIVDYFAHRHLDAVSRDGTANHVRQILEYFVSTRSYADLCRYELDYDDLTANDAYHLRQVLAFYQKRVDLEIGVDRREVARQAFVESEQRCKDTNDIFRQRASGGLSLPLDVEAALHKASRLIAEVLGEVPSLSGLKIRFGPGATTTVKKSEASARRKLAQVFACSGELFQAAPAVLGELQGWIFGQERPQVADRAKSQLELEIAGHLESVREDKAWLEHNFFSGRPAKDGVLVSNQDLQWEKVPFWVYEPPAQAAEFEAVNRLVEEDQKFYETKMHDKQREKLRSLEEYYLECMDQAEFDADRDFYQEILLDTRRQLQNGLPERDPTASVPVVIHAGVLSFVPKNAKTDRGIVVEPTLNSMFQLGVGDYIAARLKREGVDLSDQSLNQALARDGSLTGALATLDLKMASDLISDAVVADLLPPDWYFFLSKLRTATVVEATSDKPVRLQKFSSMGNGFTFPLESLIFYGLCRGVCEDGEVVSVFGDDLIVPTWRYQALVKVLHHCGFVVNSAKSFDSGEFRESCGADFLRGTNIRPLYIKGPLTGQDMFRWHNFYVRTGQNRLAYWILSWIAPQLKIWGPDGYGDGHLVGDYTPVPHNRERGWSGHTFETYVWEVRKDHTSFPSDWIYPAYVAYTKVAIPLWDCVASRSRKIGHFPQWGVRSAVPQGAGQSTVSDYRYLVNDPNMPEKVFGEVANSSTDGFYSKHKYLGTTVPGRAGCKKVKVYILG